MQALWLENQQLRYRTDLDIPAQSPAEALVRVSLAGICSTDLELLRGYYPYNGVLGHEFVGTIVAAPDYPDRVGQRVVGEINAVCGICATCRRGDRSHCENRTVLGIIDRCGAFADYLVLPVENLLPVPESVSDEAALFTDPLAAALEIQEQVHIAPHQRVLVVGAGRLGQLIARTLKLTACQLDVLARHDRQRSALAVQGIHAIEAPESRHYDTVIDASGAPGGFDTAIRAVRPRGTIVLKSTYAGRLELDMSAIVVDEIQMIGSRCGPFRPALRLLESGLIDPRDLLDRVFDLADGPRAMDAAVDRATIKVGLRIKWSSADKAG